jgi:hypothetical protein
MKCTEWTLNGIVVSVCPFAYFTSHTTERISIILGVGVSALKVV